MLHQIINLKPSSAGISVKNKTKKIIYLKFKIMNIFFILIAQNGVCAMAQRCQFAHG
jgi:hypothetical protein